MPRALAAVIVVSVVLRLAVVLTTDAGRQPELFEYDALARSLLAGDGYVYVHFGAAYRCYYAGLAYVGATALLYAAFPPGLLAVLLAQACFSALNGLAVHRVGRELAGDLAGVVAAALAVSHPAIAYCDTHKLHPLGLDSLLTSASFALLLRLRRSPSLRDGILAGVMLGVGILQRGSLLPLLPLGMLWLWRFRAGGGSVPRAALGLAGGTLLALAPWLLRSTLLYGSPVLLTTSGEHFWIGNVSASGGAQLLTSGQPAIASAPSDLLQQVHATDERGQNELFWQAGLSFVREHPGSFVAGLARKLFRFWTFQPQSGILYPRMYRSVYLVYYFLAVALALLGGARLLQRAPRGRSHAAAALGLFALTFASVSGVHAVFYGEMRHRWALEPLLLALAAAGLLGRPPAPASPTGDRGER